MERGSEYASTGRVLDTTWIPPMSIVRGSVVGSGNKIYRTAIHSQVRNGYLYPQHGICTCPVANNCKHAAAVLLAFMWEESNFEEVDTRAPWERSLLALMGTEEPGSERKQTRSLGVQLELRPKASPRYYASAVEKINSGEIPHTSKLELTMRPVQLNEKGRWVSGNLTWQHFRYTRSGEVPTLPFDSEYDAIQVEWFCTLLQLNSFAAWNGSHLLTSDFLSPMVWNHLAQAPALGIDFRALSAKSFVMVHDAVGVRADVASEGKKLRLRPLIDETPADFDTDFAGTISDHGVYWWESSSSLKNANIHLAPTKERLSPLITGLLRSDKKITIPANGRENFEREYLPKIAKATPLVSSDHSISVPASVLPTMVLKLTHLAVIEGQPRKQKKEKTGAPGVKLSWGYDYAGTFVPMGHSPAGSVDPDHRAEQSLQRGIAAALADFPEAFAALFPGSKPTGESETNTTTLTGVPAARFVSLALPLLQQLPSLEIMVEGTATEFEELTADPLITVSAQNTETNDWFDLGVEVQIDGNKVPFTELFQALAHNEKHLMLPNGKYFELDRPEYEQLRRLIEEARSLSDSHGEDTVRISKHQASLWEDLKELATNAEATAEWKTSAGSLVNISSVEHAPVPAGINATLRPYQLEGFGWLTFLYDHALGGVLADDMGLGKTLQTLALILHANREPAATMPRTQDAAVPGRRARPPWCPTGWTRPPALRRAEGRGDTDTETIKRDLVAGPGLADDRHRHDVLRPVAHRPGRVPYASLAGLVLDEAQFVKNKATKAHHVARDMPTRFKLAITGTPMENNLSNYGRSSPSLPRAFPLGRALSRRTTAPIERQRRDADRSRACAGGSARSCCAAPRKLVSPTCLRNRSRCCTWNSPPRTARSTTRTCSANARRCCAWSTTWTRTALRSSSR